MLSYIWFWKINSKGVVFNMEPFKNFKVAAYVYAYYLEKVDEAEIQRGIDYFKKYIHLDKVYIENHRGTVDIPVEKLKAVKALFEKNGIETSGGITSTQLVDGVRKHLEDAAALEAQGMISRSEKLYVEFKMSEAERDLQNAQSQVETIAAALNSTIGQTDDYQPVTAMFILERIEPLDHFRTLAAERNPLLDQVDQTARRCDQDVAAVLERRGLGLVAHAAHDGHGDMAGDVGDLAGDLIVLLGKHARGGDDEHHGAAAVALGLLGTATAVAAATLAHGLGRSNVLQIVHGRQQEGGRLAGAGLSGGKQVAALEHHGDGAGLNGRGRRVAQVLNSTKHLVRKPQLVKGGQALGSGLDGLGSICLVGGIEGGLGHGLAGLVQNLSVGDVGYRITHMLLFLICTHYGRGMRPRGRAW